MKTVRVCRWWLDRDGREAATIVAGNRTGCVCCDVAGRWTSDDRRRCCDGCADDVRSGCGCCGGYYADAMTRTILQMVVAEVVAVANRHTTCSDG